MPELEIKTQLDELGTNLKALLETQAEQEKKYDGAIAATEQKLADAVEANAQLLQDLNAVKSAISRASTEAEAVEDEAKKAAADYAREFKGYLRTRNPKVAEVELSKFQAAALEKKALSTDSLPDGGYLVPTEMANFVATRVFETSPIRQLANVITIGGKSITVPVDDTAATGEWVGEGASRSTTSTPTVGQIELVAHEYSAKPKATHAMLEDAAFDIQAWLSTKIADIASRDENAAFVTGDGVSKPRGFTTYSAWSVNGTYERGKIEQIVSGVSGEFTADGLIDIQDALLEPYQANATWLMRRASFSAIRKLKDGESRYLLGIGLAGLDGAPFPSLTLLGRPLVFASDMPAIGSSALAAAYGDFKRAYTIVDRVGLSTLNDPYSDDAYVVFKTRKRVGGGVTNFDALKLHKLST